MNQKNELRVLEGQNKRYATIVTVYGRRRMGKIRLLREFLLKDGGSYFYIPMGGRETTLNEISRTVEDDFLKYSSSKILPPSWSGSPRSLPMRRKLEQEG